MTCGQIPKDGVRFPDDHGAILDHRNIHCGGKGLYHAAARLDSMAGIEATNEIEMIAGTMTLHRGQGTQFTIHGGDAELQATAMQAREKSRQIQHWHSALLLIIE